MRIAIFTPLFSARNETDTGIGVHYRDLAIGLKKSGEDVEVFHFPYETTESGLWNFEGIKIHSIGIKIPAITRLRGIGSFCNLVRFFDIFEAFQLFKKSRFTFLKNHKLRSYDIIESSSNRGVAFGVSTLKKRPPIFTRVSTTMKQVFDEGDNLPDLNFRLTANFEEKQILRSNFLVTHTLKHAEEVSEQLDLNPNSFSIIPHGISPSIRCKSKVQDSEKKNVRILFVGRLEHRKGFDVLIKALPIILRIVSNVHIDICGTGDMLEKAKSELLPRFHSKIDFHGYLDRSTLDFYYENCDVFVAPSRYESFGIIYLEAMKFSKPVIACDSGGTPEVVSDGRTGILVKPGDFYSLAMAVIKLSNNPVLRKEMGKRGRTRLTKLFSIDGLIENTKRHYMECLSLIN